MTWKLVLTVAVVTCVVAVRLPVLGMNDWTASAQEHNHDHNSEMHEEHVSENAQHGDHNHGETASLAASWELLQEDRADIKTAVSASDSAALHDLGLRLEATVQGMAKHRAEVEEPQQERFDSYVNQMLTLSHDLHHSGEEANMEESQKVATQVEGMMLLIASVVSPGSS